MRTLMNARTHAFSHTQVSLTKMFLNPWESHSLAWSFLLDMVRYMVVFNPLIVLLMKGALYLAF
jgi:hypothetical protein